MLSFTNEQIRDIAENLDCGMRAFVGKADGKIFLVPDELRLPYSDMEGWEAELEELENNFTDYHEIEAWTSRAAFKLMSDFAETVDSQKLQNQLFNALNRKKPFGEFKFVIDNAGSYRQRWFDFKSQWQFEFVEAQIKRLISGDDGGH